MLTLSERMNGLIGFPVEVEVDGPLTVSGRITGVYSDYIAIEQNTAYYIQSKSIKEITKNAKDNHLDQSVTVVAQQNSPTFQNQLKAYTNQWICITRIGLEELQGLLAIVNSDYAVIITKEKVKFIPNSQIICFHSLVLQSSNNESSSTESANKTSENDSQNSKSSESRNQAKDDKEDKKNSNQNKNQKRKQKNNEKDNKDNNKKKKNTLFASDGKSEKRKVRSLFVNTSSLQNIATSHGKKENCSSCKSSSTLFISRSQHH